MTLTTRKPTATPSWPIVLLAHRPGAGGTRTALEPSTSPLVGATYYVPFGVDEPDDYGLVADFDIVEHGGRVADLLDAIADVNAQPDVDGKPSLLIVDSVTPLWATVWANARTAAARTRSRRAEEEELNVWDEAARVWGEFTARIRAHRGPVIVVARLQAVELMDGWKIDAHKSLPHDAHAIVELPERGEFLLRKVNSARFNLSKPTPAPGFTVEELWSRFGITPESLPVERKHRGAVPDGDGSADKSGRDWRGELAAAGDDLAEVTRIAAAASAANAEPQILRELRARHTALLESAAAARADRLTCADLGHEHTGGAPELACQHPGHQTTATAE